MSLEQNPHRVALSRLRTKIWESDTIRLIPLTEHNLSRTFAWRNHDDHRRWFKDSRRLEWNQHLQWFRRYLETDDQVVFIVQCRDDDADCGQASIYNIDLPRGIAEIGRFLVAPEAAGQGLMRAACQRLCDLADDVLAIDLLYLEVFPENTRARHIYFRCGFVDGGVTTEGLIRMTRTRRARGDEA